MPNKLRRRAKFFTTKVTRVGRRSREAIHVRFEITAGAEQFPAGFTAIRFLSCVCPPMDCQVLALNERLPADITVKRPLPRVGPHVHDQVLFLDKCFPTVLTFEVFNPRVYF